MTIAITSNSTWNIYNFRLPAIRALQAAGYRVVVVAPVDEYVRLLSRERVDIMALNHLHRKNTGLWNNIRLWIELWQIYRRLRPSLVIHYTIKPNIFGNLAAASLRIPSICVVTGLGYTFLHRGLVQYVTALLYRFSFLFAKTVVFENEDDRRLLIRQKIVGADKSLSVKGCGVDTRHFSPRKTERSKDQVVFTFIGRLLFDKGIMEFVEAARMVRQSKRQAVFWIVGALDDDNPARVRRDMLIEWSRNGIVQYKGSTEDVRPYIAHSDWVVLPSYREGLSRVLLEAMSMGKPLITTDTAGCRETVEEGVNGFLVPVKDSVTLARVFERCCDIAPERAQEMGQAGREKAIREFESGLIGKKFLEIINSPSPALPFREG